MREWVVLMHHTRRKVQCAIDAAPDGYVVEIRSPTRSINQNARMWACLTDISKQVPLAGEMLSPEDWKCIFTAAMKKHRMVPGIDGGMVVLGAYTSRMTVADMSELQALIDSYGDEKGVMWSCYEE